MPRYYCDYCDTYLTHDSPSVRKQHNAGYKHKGNVRSYYQQFEEQQTQSLIDQRIKEHAAFQQIPQVGALYNQHLASFPQRPRLPMPMPGTTQVPMTAPLPMFRPPVLPQPITSAPGYGPGQMMPPMMAPPGSSPYPMQVNGLPQPPAMNPPTAPGGIPSSGSNGTSTVMNQAVYQANPVPAGGGVLNNHNINASAGLEMSVIVGPTAASSGAGSQDGFPYSQASESNH